MTLHPGAQPQLIRNGLSTLVVAVLLPQLKKAVRTVVGGVLGVEVVPKVCWMLCAVLTAPTAVASAVAHEIVRTGVSLHASSVCKLL